MSDVKGAEITDLLGLSQPLTKLIETVSAGIDTLYKPVHFKRMAKAKAEEIKLISEAIKQNAMLPINYQHGNVGIDSTDVQNLLFRTQQRLLQEEINRQQNMDAVVSVAAEELQGKEQVSDVPVNKDWVARFRNIAKDVSSEEMQFIWGKILAGEVENPGSFSMRTLETIRNISQEEAIAFQKISPFVVKSGLTEMFITSAPDIYEKYGIRFEDILRLDECGLMVSSSTLNLTQKIDETERIVVWTEEYAMIMYGTQEKPATISFGVHTLTRAGKELFRILQCEPNNDYFVDLAEEIFIRNKMASIRVHKINSIQNTAVEYNDEPIRIFKRT